MGLPDFENLVTRYYEDLYRFALSLARNPADACDLTQQVYAIYAEKGDQIRDLSKCKNWLFTTLYREFLKMRRHEIRRTALQEEDIAMYQGLDAQDASRRSEQHEMLGALAALDDSHRAILSLFYLDQHSYREIAEVLDIPVGTVMSRLYRAKETLRVQLECCGKSKGINILPMPSDKMKHANE